jgi:hypothetical protein
MTAPIELRCWKTLTRNRRVELQIGLEPLTLPLGEDGVDHAPDLGGVDIRELGERFELAVDPHRGVHTDREVEVRTAEVDDALEQVVDVEVARPGLVTQATGHLGARCRQGLLGDGDLELVSLPIPLGALLLGGRRVSVHGAHEAAELLALGDGGEDLPARGVLDGVHGGGVARIGHGHDQLLAPGLDGDRKGGSGQVGGYQAVESWVDRRLVEVDERDADLVGDSRHQILLGHHALARQQAGQGRTLPLLPGEHGLEIVPGQDLAVDEELAQAARRVGHDVIIGIPIGWLETTRPRPPP